MEQGRLAACAFGLQAQSLLYRAALRHPVPDAMVGRQQSLESRIPYGQTRRAMRTGARRDGRPRRIAQAAGASERPLLGVHGMGTSAIELIHPGGRDGGERNGHTGGQCVQLPTLVSLQNAAQTLSTNSLVAPTVHDCRPTREIFLDQIDRVLYNCVGRNEAMKYFGGRAGAVSGAGCPLQASGVRAGSAERRSRSRGGCGTQETARDYRQITRKR